MAVLLLLLLLTPAWAQRVEPAASDGWWRMDGRVALLAGTVPSDDPLNWPDDRVQAYMNSLLRASASLTGLVVKPEADPARLESFLTAAAQRRIAVALTLPPEPSVEIQAVVRKFGNVLDPSRQPPAIVSGEDVTGQFWQAVLSGRSALLMATEFKPLVSASLRVARMISAWTPLQEYAPANDLLLDRTSTPAFASARGDRSYLVYLPKGGSVSLATTDAPHAIVWICIDTSEVEGHAIPVAGGIVPLSAPDSRAWLAIVSK